MSPKRTFHALPDSAPNESYVKPVRQEDSPEVRYGWEADIRAAIIC